jgi:hypothetical protein
MYCAAMYEQSLQLYAACKAGLQGSRSTSHATSTATETASWVAAGMVLLLPCAFARDSVPPCTYRARRALLADRNAHASADRLIDNFPNFAPPSHGPINCYTTTTT